MKSIQIENPDFIKSYLYFIKDCKNIRYEYLLNIHKNNSYRTSDRFLCKDNSFILLNNHDEPFFCFFIISSKDPAKMDTPAISIFNNETINNSEKDFLKETIKTKILNSDYSFYYRDFLDCRGINFITEFLLNNGATSEIKFNQTINLLDNEKEIWKNIRKSYKSLINWGNRNFDILIYDKNNISSEIFNEFRKLHITAAGRETRGDKSWNTQFEMIKKHQAFLIGAKYFNKFVSFGLFYSTDFMTHYAVSASNREMFDKPLFHSLMWNAIKYAKKIGCNIFDLGNIEFHNSNENLSKKQIDIIKFKKGFGGNLYPSIDIKI